MKILFVTSGYPTNETPQYCIFVEQQAMALKKLGNHIEILYIDYKGTTNSFSEWYIRNGIQIYKWSIKWDYIKYYLVIQNKNSEVELFLKNKKYDEVAFHFGNIAQFMYINNICKKINTKTAMHFHGLNVWKDYYKNYKGRLYEFYYNFRKKRFLKNVNQIIGVSNLVCSKIRERIKSNNIHTVYNGVDNLMFQKSRTKHINDSFRILCIANLIKIKGQSYLIEAASECIKKGYDLELFFIGNGLEKDRLIYQTEKLGISNKVKFLGALKYEDVSKELKSADLFILPSYFEAFGCVYLEAMASRVVTCGCYNNGAQEIISHNIDGFLVREKNVQDIRDVIMYVMDNPEIADKIAERGLKKSSHFSWENSANKLIEVYKNAEL